MSGMIYKIPVNGEWVVFDESQAAAWREVGMGAQVDALLDMDAHVGTNRLAHFIPHGLEWRQNAGRLGGVVDVPASGYAESMRNDAVAFLSDREHDISLMVGPNQVGKTAIGCIWSLLRIVPCEPDWPIFTASGVKWHAWDGPKVWVVASYSWDNVATLWERYQQFAPRHELGKYAPNWGMYPGEKGAGKPLVFGDGKPKRVRLACGSVLVFLCYTQQQVHWEGFSADGAQFDEQVEYEKWVGWNRGTTTRGDYTPCCMTLTGHVIDDRPDTGAAGWIKRELWDGTNTHGKTVGRYRMSVESTPDAVIGAVKKRQLWDQWVNPETRRSEKQKRAAVARYWGGWEVGGGLVLEEWDRAVHTVEPFEIPKGWTRYRMVDHGESPCAALWIAVTPGGDAVIYREYYEFGRDIAQNAKGIVEASGNSVRKVGTEEDENGTVWPLYEEVMAGEEYMLSELDARSFAQKKGGGITIGQMYNRFGLTCAPSSGQYTEKLVPVMRQWLARDERRKHIKTGVEGAPRVYVFTTCVNFAAEIEGWGMRTTPAGKSVPVDKDDHLMSCFKFFVARDPQYYGDDYMRGLGIAGGVEGDMMGIDAGMSSVETGRDEHGYVAIVGEAGAGRHCDRELRGRTEHTNY